MRRVGALVFAASLVSVVAVLAEDAQPPEVNGWLTNPPAVYTYTARLVTNVVPSPVLAYKPPPTNLPPDIRRALLAFLPRGSLTTSYTTNLSFHYWFPDSLNYQVWTNLVARTNGRSTVIWAVRSHPLNWPTNPPVVQWNPTGLMWGFKGLTALSPCWEGEGLSGQVPITALTRRHGYARGHGMGPDGFRQLLAGKKVWFVARDNTLVERKVVREVVRTYETSRRDYSILLFDRDLPDSIDLLPVVPTTDILAMFNSRYVWRQGAPCPLLKTEQTGNVSADLPGFEVNTWKGGDSGSPNLLLVGTDLVFCSGRSTSAASPEMQADMDELCRLQHLDSRNYQLRWYDLSRFPKY